MYIHHLTLSCDDISCLAGEPSHCYKHVGDGICEPFERTNNMLDCGFYTPEGSHDQWAVTVSVKPGYLNRNCPPDVVIGPPSVEHVCNKVKPGYIFPFATSPKTIYENMLLHMAVRIFGYFDITTHKSTGALRLDDDIFSMSIAWQSSFQVRWFKTYLKF